jgi:hypothetical protein
MNEPYLQAFRCPKLVAELAAVEIPLSAVLRQDEHEPFGFPWRLVYLGDPLFRFHHNPAGSRRSRLPAPGKLDALVGASRWTACDHGAAAGELDRQADELARLQWCLAAAIRALCQEPDPKVPSDRSGERGQALADRRATLLEIDRRKLDPPHRPVLDELVTDTLFSTGDLDRLLSWLLRIPPAESRPRNERAIETAAVFRLAELSTSRSIGPALDLWDALIRRYWSDQTFPVQVTRRLGDLVNASPRPVKDLYRQRLAQAKRDLSFGRSPSPSIGSINEELKRTEADR